MFILLDSFSCISYKHLADKTIKFLGYNEKLVCVSLFENKKALSRDIQWSCGLLLNLKSLILF